MAPLPALFVSWLVRLGGTAGRTRVVLALVGSAAVVTAGCSAAGELHSAGPASAASAPVPLWPERTATARPLSPGDTGEGPSPVPGVPRVSSGDIREVDPRALVKTDAEGSREAGGEVFPEGDEEVSALIASCLDPRTVQENCSIRPAAYHDLTSDGSPELIIGVDLNPRLFSVRAYTLKDGTVTRILSVFGPPASVEVAGGELVVREPAGAKGYESSTIYKWDGEKMAYSAHLMLEDKRSDRSGTRPSRTAVRLFAPETGR